MQASPDREVPLGGQTALDTEELAAAKAATWRTSTPNQNGREGEEDDATGHADEILGAVHGLLERLGRQSERLEHRFDALATSVEHVQTRVHSLESTTKTKNYYQQTREDDVVPSLHAHHYSKDEERLAAPADGKPDELWSALERIETLATGTGSPKTKRSVEKPVVRPAMFDGKGSWEDYHAQFEILATLNGWVDGQVKATYLAVSLSGPARAVLGDLSEAERCDYAVLVKALDNRFGTGNRSDMYRATLKSRMRKADESLPELAQAIRRLARHAFPGVPSDIRDTLARDHFVDALGDADMRWKVHQSRPKTLDEALTIAVELEAFIAADRQRGRPVRAARSSSEPQSESVRSEPQNTSFQEDLRQIKDLLLELQQTKRTSRRPDGCWSCGERNHLARSCPKKQPQSSGNGQQPSSRA